MVSPNAQSQLNPQSNTTQQSGSVQPGPGSQAGQGNPPANNRASPGPSDESMKKALAALGLPAQTQGLRSAINCKLYVQSFNETAKLYRSFSMNLYYRCWAISEFCTTTPTYTSYFYSKARNASGAKWSVDTTPARQPTEVLENFLNISCKSELCFLS